MKSPLKKKGGSPKSAAKTGTGRAVPDFTRLHQQWADKLEAGKAGDKKPCTVVQEFGFTRSGAKYSKTDSHGSKPRSATSRQIGSPRTKVVSSKVAKTPSRLPTKKVTKTPAPDFEVDESSLASILTNTGITDNSKNPESTSRPSYFRVPKTPYPEDSRQTICQTPNTRGILRGSCYTEGATRKMSRLAMDDELTAGPRLVNSNEAPSRRTVVDTASTPSTTGGRAITRSVLAGPSRVLKASATPDSKSRICQTPKMRGCYTEAATRKMSRLAMEEKSTPAPSYMPALSSMDKEDSPLVCDYSPVTPGTYSRVKRVMSPAGSAHRHKANIRSIFKSHNDKTKEHRASPKVKSVVTSENLLNISQIEAEEKRLQEEMENLRRMKELKMKSENQDGKTPKANQSSKLLKREFGSPLQTLSPNVKLEHQRSPRSPNIFALSPKIDFLSPKSAASPKFSKQGLRPHEGLLRGTMMSVLDMSDKENVSPLAGVNFSGKKSVPFGGKWDDLNQSLSDTILEVENLESKLSGGSGSFTTEVGISEQLERVKNKQRKLLAIQRKLQAKLKSPQSWKDSPQKKSKKSDSLSPSETATDESPFEVHEKIAEKSSEVVGEEAACNEALSPDKSGESGKKSLDGEPNDAAEEAKDAQSTLPVPVFYSPPKQPVQMNPVADKAVLMSPLMTGSAQLMGGVRNSQRALFSPTLAMSPLSKSARKADQAIGSPEKNQACSKLCLDSEPAENINKDIVPLSPQRPKDKPTVKCPQSPILQRLRELQPDQQLIPVKSPESMAIAANLPPFIVAPKSNATPWEQVQQHNYDRMLQQCHDMLLDQEVSLFTGQAAMRLGSGFSPAMNRCRDPVASLLHTGGNMYFQPIDGVKKTLNPLAGSAFSALVSM